jgi:hypothetical protein
MPSIRFFLADPDHPIDSGHPLWQRPLPDRKATVSPGLLGSGTVPLTYGDYFNAVSDFCASNGWDPILCASRQARQHSVTKDDISQLSIFLEKHGALYHPARIVVTIQNQDLSYVINVAATVEGRRTLPVEIEALKRLGEQRPFGWLPTVYGDALEPVPMFLANWFDGYHEFHLTRQAGKQQPSIMVWDGAASPTLLSERQSAALYRQAAMILTACYDPITTDQIYPWHHAAGDFVLRVEDNTVDVKLITVRGYAPIFTKETAPTDERELLDNLIAFLVLLSIRMRLDRIDGVSEIGWAPDPCLVPMIDGFFKGLDLTARLSGFPDTFPSLFQDYFDRQHPAQLMDMAKQLVSADFGQPREETRILERHLEHHVHQLYRCIGHPKRD